MEKPITTYEFPVVNGLKIEKTPRGQYRIGHESGAVLGFVLQGRKEALNMQNALARMMIVQETCRQVNDLRISCKAEVSGDGEGAADLFVKNSNWMPGHNFKLRDDILLTDTKIAEMLQGSPRKHILPDGTYPFVAGISTFLNTVQDSEVHLAEKRANQVAGK